MRKKILTGFEEEEDWSSYWISLRRSLKMLPSKASLRIWEM